MMNRNITVLPFSDFLAMVEEFSTLGRSNRIVLFEDPKGYSGYIQIHENHLLDCELFVEKKLFNSVYGVSFDDFSLWLFTWFYHESIYYWI